MKQDSIVLIGMPGVGKSTIGMVLAKALDFNFVDLDKYIEYTEGEPITQIIKSRGEQGFSDLEARKLLQIDLQRSVVSPGGSIVYSKDAMEYLSKNSTIVYLEDTELNIKRRLGDVNARGIVWKGAKSISELYELRRPLYESYFDIKVPCNHRSEFDIAKEIATRLSKQNKVKRN